MNILNNEPFSTYSNPLIIVVFVFAVFFSTFSYAQAKTKNETAREVLTRKAQGYIQQVKDHGKFHEKNAPLPSDTQSLRYWINYAVLSGGRTADDPLKFAGATGNKIEDINQLFKVNKKEQGFKTSYTNQTIGMAQPLASSDTVNRFVYSLDHDLARERSELKTVYSGVMTDTDVYIRGTNWISGPPTLWFMGPYRSSILTASKDSRYTLTYEQLGTTNDNNPIVQFTYRANSGIVPSNKKIKQLREKYDFTPVSIRRVLMVIDRNTRYPARIYRTHLFGFEARDGGNVVKSKYRLFKQRYVRDEYKQFKALSPQTNMTDGDRPMPASETDNQEKGSILNLWFDSPGDDDGEENENNSAKKGGQPKQGKEDDPLIMP